jgi:hemerythrin superfamily protein
MTCTIREYFEQDHERLDALFKAFQEGKRRDQAQANAAFKQFKTGLQRHIVWEENLLFPVWEQKTGITDAGPTHVMRLEHRQIRDCLEAIDAQVREDNPESDQEEQRLLGILGAHNRKEERILYPAIDESLDDHERRALFQAMESIPEERDGSCCGDHG